MLTFTFPLPTPYRHVVYAPSTHDAYAGATFPGLVDLMFQIDTAPDQDWRWSEVKRHLAALVFCIESAVSVLEPVHTIN